MYPREYCFSDLSYLWEIGSAPLSLSLSLNFYSLHGTDDKKIAQTENPYSFLSYYTCSYPSILPFLFFRLSSSSPLFFSVCSSWSFFLAHVTTLHLSASFHLHSYDAHLASLLPSHRRISRKSSRVGLGLLARTAWKDSPDPIAVSVPHLLPPLTRYLSSSIFLLASREITLTRSRSFCWPSSLLIAVESRAIVYHSLIATFLETFVTAN